MYGILIEGLHHYLTEKFGEEFWLDAAESVMGARKVIQTQQVYSETLLPRLVTYVAGITGLQEENVYFELGQSFISYLSKVGYASLLRITGSGFPEFLNELDDLHHHLQYTYPHLKPPAFVLVSQTDTTVDLMYTSKREHYAHYVRGQLTKVASVFYDLDVNVELIEHVKQLDSNRFTLRITNEKGRWPRMKHQQFLKDAPEKIPTHISSEQFLDLFNFCILFAEDLKLQHVSNGFKRFHEVKVGKKLFDVFQLDRPKIDAVFTQIKNHIHNTFELVLAADTCPRKSERQKKTPSQKSYKFKGQMLYIEEVNMMAFIGSPVLSDMKKLNECGMYISDLNLFDQNREIILAGDQRSDDVVNMLKKQFEASKQLEKSMKRLSRIRKLTDDLLYQCIPRAVARRLRDGTPPLETIKSFESVSICFTKVVDFATRCTQTSVEGVIRMLNQMYTLFDAISEAHKVYKVETIGDSYMFVSGAPLRTQLHAAHITEAALDMLRITRQGLCWPDPMEIHISAKGAANRIQLLVGCNTGPIVAGVVGFKTPRYCLFGDAVNVASRMVSTGLPDKIHVSASFAEALAPYPYMLEERGPTVIKGKGELTTFFVIGRDQQYSVVDLPGWTQTFDHVLKEDFEQTEQSSDEISVSQDSEAVGWSGASEGDEVFESSTVNQECLDTNKAKAISSIRLQVPTFKIRRPKETNHNVEGLSNIQCEIPQTVNIGCSQKTEFAETRSEDTLGITSSYSKSEPVLTKVLQNTASHSMTRKLVSGIQEGLTPQPSVDLPRDKHGVTQGMLCEAEYIKSRGLRDTNEISYSTGPTKVSTTEITSNVETPRDVTNKTKTEMQSLATSKEIEDTDRQSSS
ncbi:hypothetical protein CRM22_007800 [Opisthorchis felineus]|uniref:guanylate cyclase n=1 Tax=Opisthorchis felineus TaxID=147828 RepID=A0A4S2LMM1_OPIFE|nr:hypothetical protein CRM22_007800 [Opisthorchis felineus]